MDPGTRRDTSRISIIGSIHFRTCYEKSPKLSFFAFSVIFWPRQFTLWQTQYVLQIQFKCIFRLKTSYHAIPEFNNWFSNYLSRFSPDSRNCHHLNWYFFHLLEFFSNGVYCTLFQACMYQDTTNKAHYVGIHCPGPCRSCSCVLTTLDIGEISCLYLAEYTAQSKYAWATVIEFDIIFLL